MSERSSAVTPRGRRFHSRSFDDGCSAPRGQCGKTRLGSLLSSLFFLCFTALPFSSSRTT